MRLQLSVSAQDLPHASLLGGIPDPFAVVTLVDKSRQGNKPILLGQTETLLQTKDPDWTKVFYIEDFQLGTPMTLFVTIYSGENRKSFGSSAWDVGSILGAPGSMLAKRLKDGKGSVLAHLEEATNSGTLHFQLRGYNFLNTEGGGVFNKSDPFFELQRWHMASRTMDTVFRSHHIQNNTNPIWNESFVEIHSLCGGNTKQKFRILVLDHNSNGKHDVMGHAQLDLDEFLASVNDTALKDENSINLEKSLPLTKAGKEVGKILIAAGDVVGAVKTDEEELEEPDEPPQEDDIVVGLHQNNLDGKETMVEASPASTAENPPRPTFIRYISGGCQLRVLVAVDATASNGNPRDDTSLHHFKADGYNAYEDALYAICSILSTYDSDQKYPVYGFGAKQNGVLSHCFPMGSTNEVDGVSGILDAYRMSFRSGTVMSSPRDFSEVIHKATQDAKEELEHSQCYSVLVLLTNGLPADMNKTVNALKNAQDAPLSIVAVGVGSGSFSGMQQFEQLSNEKDRREMFRFVEYEQLKDDENMLTKAALDHIPHQMVSYFISKSILPQPDQQVEEIAVEPYNEMDDIEVPIEINDQGQAVVTGNVEIPERRKKMKKILKQGVKMGKQFLKQNNKLVGKIRRKYENKILKMI